MCSLWWSAMEITVTEATNGKEGTLCCVFRVVLRDFNPA